jgi:hypothetical protein
MNKVESRVFLQLDIENIPNVDNIGFLTPSFFRKSGIQSISEICNIAVHDREIVGFYLTDIDSICLKKAEMNHGPNFVSLWNHLLVEMGFQTCIGKDFVCTYSNMWVCKRSMAIEFILFMRNVIKTMLSFSGKMSEILHSNSGYVGNATNMLEQKAGFRHYTYHAFLCERIIGLFAHRNDYTIVRFPKQASLGKGPATKELPIDSTRETTRLGEKPKRVVCIMACHTNSRLQIHVVKNNIQFFKEICTTILVVNSLVFRNHQSELQANSENVKFYYVKNDRLACISKYIHVLQNFDYANYDKIIVCNDSFLVIQSLAGFQQTCFEDVDMTTLLTSNEVPYHSTDFLRCYNTQSVKIVLEYYLKHAHTTKNVDELIRTFEMCTADLFASKNAVFETEQTSTSNIHMHDEMVQTYLSNGYPIVMMKKLTSIVQPYANNTLPKDFQANEYKSLHKDLQHFSDKEAVTHFQAHGWKERRVYKQGQQLVLPEYLRNALDRIGFAIHSYM